jgi:hypothetical protein
VWGGNASSASRVIVVQSGGGWGGYGRTTLLRAEGESGSALIVTRTGPQCVAPCTPARLGRGGARPPLAPRPCPCSHSGVTMHPQQMSYMKRTRTDSTHTHLHMARTHTILWRYTKNDLGWAGAPSIAASSAGWTLTEPRVYSICSWLLLLLLPKRAQLGVRGWCKDRVSRHFTKHPCQGPACPGPQAPTWTALSYAL